MGFLQAQYPAQLCETQHGDGEVIIIEGKKARFDKDRAELRRYFSILRWDHWYRFR